MAEPLRGEGVDVRQSGRPGHGAWGLAEQGRPSATKSSQSIPGRASLEGKTEATGGVLTPTFHSAVQSWRLRT